MAAQGGTLTLVVENILFGDNRFIGFDASLSVGIPSYFEAIGGIEGTLMLAVWALDPADHPAVKIGVDGSIDVKIFIAEATLVIKTINGIPLPDELYLYVGGLTPGLNVDGFGVFWITGAGGGFANLYESIMSKSKVPAFSLSLEGGFSLFQILFARLKLTLSARGIEAQLKGLGFNRSYSNNDNIPVSGAGKEMADLLTIIPSMGFSIYWYPKFKASAHIEVNVLDIIDGGGYILLEQNTETDRMFFEALATCAVQTPNIPLIGRIKLGGVDIGVDIERIYGALHVLMLDMGVCYYYGGDVDFSFGKYDAPAPTLLSVKVGELSTGEPVYMAFGTNITQVASTQTSVLQLSDIARLDNKTPAIISASDRMHHTFSLGDYADGDIALTVSYKAENLEEARGIAKGGLFNKGLELTDANGEKYPLTWLDVTSAEIDPEVADSANALLNYDEATKEASVTISFTNQDDFDTAWQLTSSVATELVLYSLTRLADIESVGIKSVDNNEGTAIVKWHGSQLGDFDKLMIAAVSEDGDLYPLYETEDTKVISSGSAKISAPESMPSGDYTIQIAAKDEQGNVNDVEKSTDKWSYVNPQQPGNPTVTNTRLGGDYTIDVDVSANGGVAYSGYVTVIEEYDTATGAWDESEFAQQDFSADSTTLSVGGSFTSSNFIQYIKTENDVDSYITKDEYLAMKDDEKLNVTVQTLTYSKYLNLPDEQKEKVSVETMEIGLEAGTKYRVRVNAYVITEHEDILYSEDQYSEEIIMVQPDPAEVTVTGVQAKTVTEENSLGENVTRDVFTDEMVSLELTADMAAQIKWELDNGDISGEGTIPEGKALAVSLNPVSTETQEQIPLNQGEHTLKIHATNENGDEKTTFYSFRVDSEAPKLQINSPQTGSFYDSTVTLTGISEAGATVKIALDGKEYTTIAVPETVHRKDANGNVTVVEGGHFSVEIEMDPTVYEQTITVSAMDDVGNESQQYDLILVNRMIAQYDSELAIYLNGQDVTGQTIPAGSEGLLELRYVQRDDSGVPITSVAVPANSNQGSLAYWETYIVEGYGSVTRDKDINLETSSDVNGMLTVTVDKQQVSAVLGGNNFRDRSKFTVTLPENPEGYTVTTDQSLEVAFNGSFSFQVSVKEGYDGTKLKVFANNMELTAVDGVYTVTDIRTDVKISVIGVADITPPEVTVTVSDNKWTEFLNTITFGLFFNKTQDAKITASDTGSGIYSISYVVSAMPIALDDLADAGWQEYRKTIKLDADGNYVVYAKVVDNAGNIRYVSSNGLVIDATAPGVSGIEDGGVYTGNVTFSIVDRNIASVTINGKEVTGQLITLEPAKDPQTIVIKDRAGNETVLTVTVNEVPEIEEPVCDGKADCPSLAFTDLDSSAWYHLSTDYVIKNGLMQGYGDGTFQPGEKLSRAMMVQVLYNLEGKPAVTGSDDYADTDPAHWYTNAIIWADKNGIVKGYGNGNFGPDDPVTREQMATIFHRYSTLKGYSLTEGNYDHFSDKDAVSQYAQSAMRWAVGNGLLVGMGDGTLCPKCNTTRAEFATVIQRFIETIAK